MGAWIEMTGGNYAMYDDSVAPHVGAWIEIYFLASPAKGGCPVAPHVGAWIEIVILVLPLTAGYVAPHVGAWIEI